MECYSNKRILIRKHGRFAKLAPADFGIGGVCPHCQHLLLRHYDGDPRDTSPDPRKIRYRCFTCEPLTESEQALLAEIEAAKPKRVGFMDLLKVAEAA